MVSKNCINWEASKQKMSWVRKCDDILIVVSKSWCSEDQSLLVTTNHPFFLWNLQMWGETRIKKICKLRLINKAGSWLHKCSALTVISDKTFFFLRDLSCDLLLHSFLPQCNFFMFKLTLPTDVEFKLLHVWVQDVTKPYLEETYCIKDYCYFSSNRGKKIILFNRDRGLTSSQVYIFL